MRALFSSIVLLVMLTFLGSCSKTTKTTKTSTTEVSETYVADNYTKKEVAIVMRDGVKLHTTIYSPKDTSKKYPIVMQRTPYGSSPYG